MKYRSDIDGLRALAVLPVVLFHAKYPWIPGGFVGVDIFFVISGYLISSIIQKEISSQRFTFANFYLRRARRILPALFIVLLATLVAGYFFLLPEEYIALANTTLASLTFVPNIHFFFASSMYFGLDVATEPLIHTWSLGVEEQFYIVFPLLLVFLYRSFSNTNTGRVIVLLFAASLAANIILAPVLTKFTFYMLPTRAWELLAGAMLGLGLIPSPRGKVISNLGALLGLLLILGTMLLLSEDAVFPGVNAIYPVLGAALIIWANGGHDTLVGKLLSARPLVWIGLISYSLYLWHWPVAVYTMMLTTGPAAQAFVVVFSILLATLSYRWIESRYRGQSESMPTVRMGKELGLFAGVIVVGMSVVLMGNGLNYRIPPAAFDILTPTHLLSGVDTVEPNCLDYGKVVEDRQSVLCQLGKQEGEPHFIVWGDSHAMAISPALHNAALAKGVSGLLLTVGGCQPLLGVSRKGKDRCQIFNDEALALVEKTPSIQQVYLVGYWRVPLLGHSYDNSNYLIMDAETRFRSSTENRAVFQRGLERTLDALGSRSVYLLQDIPEVGSQFGKSVSNTFVRQNWLGTNQQKEYFFHDRAEEYDQAFARVRSALPQQSFHFLEVKPILCKAGQCPLLINEKLVYSDGDHLSHYGASLLAPLFSPLLEELTAPAQNKKL
jgi:peptidoglycan/LPS O-acetylase OafA/YrhL